MTELLEGSKWTKDGGESVLSVNVFEGEGAGYGYFVYAKDPALNDFGLISEERLFAEFTRMPDPPPPPAGCRVIRRSDNRDVEVTEELGGESNFWNKYKPSSRDSMLTYLGWLP